MSGERTMMEATIIVTLNLVSNEIRVEARAPYAEDAIRAGRALRAEFPNVSVTLSFEHGEPVHYFPSERSVGSKRAD